MAAQNDEGLVLRVVDFSETSYVVTLFTQKTGKITALAKGARRIKNPYDYALDFMSRCTVTFFHRTTDVMDLLTEAKLVRRYKPKSLDSFYGGFYVVELLDRFTEPGAANEELFTLSDQILERLNAPITREKLLRWMLRFQFRMLNVLGYTPSMYRCVECGDEIPVTDTAVALGLIDGGVLCRKCRVGHQKMISLRRSVLEAMRCFAAEGSGAWEHISLEARTIRELRSSWNLYLNHTLGFQPVMQTWFNKIDVK